MYVEQGTETDVLRISRRYIWRVLHFTSDEGMLKPTSNTWCAVDGAVKINPTRHRQCVYVCICLLACRPLPMPVCPWMQRKFRLPSAQQTPMKIAKHKFRRHCFYCSCYSVLLFSVVIPSCTCTSGAYHIATGAAKKKSIVAVATSTLFTHLFSLSEDFGCVSEV